MAQFVITFVAGAAEATCGLCDQRTALEAGPQLAVAESLAPVCRGCGAKHAPAETALLDLARCADRVGTIARHNTYWIPLRAQLDLVHTAEHFAYALTEQQKKLNVAI
jgi:hypothetical protein